MAEAEHGWIEAEWPAPPNVRTLITTRQGGVSRGSYRSLNLGLQVGDDPAAVAENRRRVRGSLPAEPRWLTQVHGVLAVAADKIDAPVEADAAFTREPDVVCAVMVADCLPVLLCDRVGRVVAVAHAGWRGLAAGVVERTIAELGVKAEQLMAYLGPAIGPSAFEVGNDVRDAFLACDTGAASAFAPHTHGKWLADLFQLARRRLLQAGVDRVYGGDQCTFSRPDRYFSHRRDKVSGRMGAFIWRTG